MKDTKAPPKRNDIGFVPAITTTTSLARSTTQRFQMLGILHLQQLTRANNVCPYIFQPESRIPSINMMCARGLQQTGNLFCFQIFWGVAKTLIHSGEIQSNTFFWREPNPFLTFASHPHVFGSQLGKAQVVGLVGEGYSFPNSRQIPYRVHIPSFWFRTGFHQ